jgi:predicted RNA-binding Zn ribbon-like protein
VNAVQTLRAAPGEALSPALALVNTEHARGGRPVDDLADPEVLRTWLIDRDLVEQPERLVVRPRDLEVTRQLRAAVRALLLARIEGGRPAPAALAVVNERAAAAPLVASVEWPDADAPRSVVRAMVRSGVPCALATIAADAIDLVCGTRAPALLACPAPGCVRLLVRDHARRQWCSTGCGDRVRASRYYRRHREAAAAGAR